MKRIARCLGAAALVLPLAGIQAGAQQALPGEAVYKLKTEAFDNSQIKPLSLYMTDLMGSRLAASQQKLRSEQLMVTKLKELGFSNVHVEKAVDFAKGGWDNEKTYVAMTKPYYCAFTANPLGWTAGTDGLVKGECVFVDAENMAEYNEKFKGKLQGKIVLIPETQEYEVSYEPLAHRYTEEELQEIARDPRPGVEWEHPASGRSSSVIVYETYMFRRNLPSLLAQEGVMAIVRGSGSFNVPGASGVSYKVGDPYPTTQMYLPIEDHGRMCRLARMGETVEMEMEIRNVFTDNQQINNVIAEIPGTDPKLKDEIVLIGAHFDSWHGSTGAADNASGCITMTEALRIIKESGIKPRRTIRLALWGGEEQGLYGSRGYAANYLYDSEKQKKKNGYDKFALYLNMDNGSGRFRGVYLEHNDMAIPFWKAWMEPVESLGFNYLTLRSTGSTDHVMFTRIGLPAYQFIQDEIEYNRTYHTIMDTWERLSLDDLTIDAAITAIIALSAAQDDNHIPFLPID